MKKRINDIYIQVEDWHVYELERLVSEVEDLIESKILKLNKTL